MYAIAAGKKTKNELAALAFAVQPSLTAQEISKEPELEYKNILQLECSGFINRDPRTIPEGEWNSEELSIYLYPKIYVEEIQRFLTKHSSTWKQSLVVTTSIQC